MSVRRIIVGVKGETLEVTEMHNRMSSSRAVIPINCKMRPLLRAQSLHSNNLKNSAAIVKIRRKYIHNVS